MTLSLEKAVAIMDRGLIFLAKVLHKKGLIRDVYYKKSSFSFHKIMDFSCVDYLWIEMFLFSHSDGTHSLQR